MTTRKLNGPLGGDYQTDGSGNAVPINTYPLTEADDVPLRLADHEARVTAAEGDIPVARAIARSNRVVAIGDSLTSGGTDNSVGRLGGYTSPITYASLISKQRIRHAYNAGIASQTSTQIAARFQTDVVAKTPGAVVILCGTNDSSTGDMAATRANITSMVEQALAAGILPCLMTLPPQNSADTTQRTNLRALNFWIMQYAAKRGIPVVDAYSCVVDPTTGNYASGLNSDVIHWNEAGARKVGQALSDVLSPLLPNSPLPLHGSAAAYGNLVSNGCFIGDANTDGIADNWAVAGTAGTATKSLVSGDYPVLGNWQKLEETGTGTRALVCTNVTSGFSAGDVLAMCALVKTSGCVAAARRINLMTGFNDAGFTTIYPLYNWIADIDYGAIYGEFVVPAGASQLSAQMQMSGGTAAMTASIQVAQVTILNLTQLGLA